MLDYVILYYIIAYYAMVYHITLYHSIISYVPPSDAPDRRKRGDPRLYLLRVFGFWASGFRVSGCNAVGVGVWALSGLEGEGLRSQMAADPRRRRTPPKKETNNNNNHHHDNNNNNNNNDNDNNDTTPPPHTRRRVPGGGRAARSIRTPFSRT